MAELKIKPEQIKIGYAIKLPCSWLKHPFMSASMLVENSQQIAIILSLKLDFVFFYPEKSQLKSVKPQENETQTQDASIEQQQVIKETERLRHEKQQRIAAATAHRAAIQRTEKAFINTLADVKATMQMLMSRPLNAIEDAQGIIKNMSETILGADSLFIHLMSNGKKEEQNFYFHSLNVSVLSMLLAEKLNYSALEVETVGIGALFHDVGKVKVPSQILRKKPPLTGPELNVLKMHPRYGIELVNLTGVFPEDAKVIIEQHHEYADGSGYPLGLTAKSINKLSALVCIVNEFDNLCHPLDPSKARSPHHALSFMFTHMKGKFVPEILASFIKLMGIYPPGTIVHLSDGSIGIVMSASHDDLTKPEVLLYNNEIPRLEAPVQQLTSDFKITKVAVTTELAPEVVQYLNPRAQTDYYFDSKK